MKTVLVVCLLCLLAGCVQEETGTVIGYDANAKPSNWNCPKEKFTAIKTDDGHVVSLCGYKGAIGERVKWTK